MLTITIGGQSGNFQLNVMLPVIAYNLLQSLELLGIASRNLADHALAGFIVNTERLGAALDRNPILVTALNPVIGYEKGAAIAKKAYAEGRPILEVAVGNDRLERGRAAPAARSVGADDRRDQRSRILRLMMDSLYSKTHIRESLEPQPSGPDEDMLWLAGASPEVRERMRASLQRAMRARGGARAAGGARLGYDGAAHAARRDAQGSRRSDQLSRRPHRAGGSRCLARGAARGARGDRSVESFVEFAGYLPDHWVGTGFRVTPAVGFVSPLYELRIATAEVHDVFEVPLEFILDAANHKSRLRQMGGVTLEVYDIPYGERNIWGATAGMLLTLRRLLQARADTSAMTARGMPELLAIMERLRAPDGCPWDRQQTFASIAPYTIEEAYEVADAIERGDISRI